MADIDVLADQIVEALMRRAEQDSGMTLEEVQRLLVLRVRTEAAQAGLHPRELMQAVWLAWERHNRPPMLGEAESQRIVDSLVRKGILIREEGPGGEAIIRWAGLPREQVEAISATLTHEERLFLHGVLRYLRRNGAPAA